MPLTKSVLPLSAAFSVKESVALDRMATAIDRSRKPVIMCSFGKESMVLLDLFRRVSRSCTIAYFELGVIERKHRFAKEQIRRFWPGTKHILPHRSVVIKGINNSSLAYEFDLSSGSVLSIFGATFDDTLSSRLICGRELQNIQKSGGHPPYDWDCVISGRRCDDVDATVGALSWHSAADVTEAGTRLVMPLLEWSDADLALYVSQRNILIDEKRYVVRSNQISPRSDRQNDPDYLPACIRCLHGISGDQVRCAKANTMLTIGIPMFEQKHYAVGAVPPVVMC